MRAIILVGGRGTRLMPLTQNTSKSLIKVGGKTILSRSVESLIACDINEVTFLTSRGNEATEKFVRTHYPSLRTVYIYDPEDKDPKSSYIYSIALSSNLLVGDDVIFLHGDTVFSPRLMRELVAFEFSAALVNRNIASSKDFNVRINNGLITQIGINVVGDSVRCCLPVYKFLNSDFSIWIAAILDYVKNGRLTCYAEDALNDVLGKIKFYPLYYDQAYGLEIDNFDDLRRAEGLLSSERI